MSDRKSMVEAVARAICRSDCDTLKITACRGRCRAFDESAPPNSYFDKAREMYSRQAAAAIQAHLQALRTPTEGMVDAGVNVSMDISAHQVFHAWQAMIDAALTDPSP